MSPPAPLAHPPADGTPEDASGIRLAGIVVEESAPREAVAQLARRLGLAVLDPAAESPPSGSVLVWSPAGLELRCPMGTVRVDFLAGREALRVRRGSGRREPLARALGLNARPPTRRVVDATAGLGRDAFLLACLGVDVLAVEQSPVVGALLQDALQRGRAASEPTEPLTRIQLRVADARTVLDGLPTDEAPDAIYIDPMFRPRRKSSLVKKEMRILSELVGGTTPAETVADLVRAALVVARRRVVVKRPADAPPFRGAPRPPDLSTPGGRTTCYDVWLC